MRHRRRLWARLLVVPALWSAVVAAAPAPIHACGGTDHAPAPSAAVDVAGHHAGHGVAADHDASDAPRAAHRVCTCVGCGAPAVATTVPPIALPAASPLADVAPPDWPATARRTVARSAHALPFANGPPRR